MAHDTKAFIVAKTTLAIVDYTGSPVSLALGTLVPDSLVVPVIWKKEKIQVWITSSTGQSLYAMASKGIAQGQTYSFQFVALDVNDNAETTAPAPLVKALMNDSVAGTAYSGLVFTSQLTGGSALQAKVTITEINESGVSHVTTVPSVITDVQDGNVGGFKAWTVTAEIVGALTLA